MVRHLIAAGDQPTVLDLRTYASDEARLEDVRDRYELCVHDVADAGIVREFRRADPDIVLHFAAETHVTRSEHDPDLFFRTNLEGTRQVLAAAARSGVRLVIHISTDEVYGPCLGPPFKEAEKQAGEGLASSAYARSKALADDLAVSMYEMVPTIVVRPTNCFGPWQHPEKAIPRWITRGLRNERLPVWGDGQQERDWMYVADLCSAIDVVTSKGRPGEVYNIAPEREPLSNMKIAGEIARLMGIEDKVYLAAYDRPDHDRRYAIDASKLRALGWSSRTSLVHELEETIDWYREHKAWWTKHVEQAEGLYDDEGERKE